MTPEEITQAQATFMAVQNARLILLGVSPADATRAAIFACEALAGIAAPEGVTLAPLVAALRGACQKAMASISAVDKATLELSDEGAWTEGFIEACARFGIGAPGSLALTMELILHSVAGLPTTADDPLDLKVNATPEDQRLATHVLGAYRKVMKFHLRGK